MGGENCKTELNLGVSKKKGGEELELKKTRGGTRGPQLRKRKLATRAKFREVMTQAAKRSL